MKGRRNSRPLFNDRCQNLDLSPYIFLFIFSLYIIISGSTAQQEEDWTWSVTVGDIEGLDKNYVPDSYIINDSANISWNIKPSSGSTIIDTILRVYPKDADRSKYEAYRINIPPNDGYRYVPLRDASLPGDISTNEKIYNVEVNATAVNPNPENPKLPHEWHTHKIEIIVSNPGTLVIQKRIPGWDDADLSGWRFRVAGPVDTKIMSTSEKATDNSGKAVFSGLRPGMYRVEEVTRDGWLQIPQRNKFKRTTDTRNLVRQGPVFGWHQRAISQVIIILTTFFKEFRK